MIIITFANISDYVDPARNGSLQTLSFIPSVFEPMSLVTDKVTKYNFSGNAKRTTVLGSWRTSTIATPYVTDEDFKYFREFYESVSFEQPFDVDATALSGLGETYRVFIPDNQLDMPRFAPCIGFTSEWSIREISAESE